MTSAARSMRHPTAAISAILMTVTLSRRVGLESRKSSSVNMIFPRSVLFGDT
tara:strand:+ start:4691 stop:4846 length:156 start_codon:yes stop_codon:yes gene_type:complete